MDHIYHIPDFIWVHLGSFLDSVAIHKLFHGAYGAFVNTDGFTVGIAAEVNASFNIVRR